jgi:hypothetical protein
VNLSGGSSGSGGGVSNYGTLIIESSIVSRNTANSGGGVSNSGVLSLEYSTISGNTARLGGGVSNGGTRKVVAGATLKNANKTGPYCYYNYFYGEFCYYYYSYSGNLTINNSTISKNSARVGGGVVNNSGDVIIQDSTISKNSAEGFSYYGTYYDGIGGGISNHGSVTVTGSTISANHAHTGGGVFNDATLTLNRSLISGSTASVGAEIADYGSVTSENFNLFGSNGNAGVTGFIPGLTDIVPGHGVKVGKILGPLKNNGGPTQTHALKRGSPAADVISFSDPGCTGTDQRGVARPQGASCDIGAFESELP